MAKAVDVVVVGCGVIGASVAHALSRSGRRVLVLDARGAPGHGSTSASSALIRFNYSTPAGVAAAWESQHCWVRWAEHLGWIDPAGLVTFHRTGVLHLDSPAMARRPVLDLFDEHRIPYEEFDARRMQARFPLLDVGRYWPNRPITDDAFWEPATSVLGGYFTPDAGFIDDPAHAAHNLASAAEHAGARLWFNRRLTGIRQHGSTWWLTLGDGSRLEAPVVVNAAGPWSTQVNTMAGVGGDFTVTLRALRQEVHYTRAPKPVSECADSWPVPGITDLDLGVYMRPGLAGTFLVGGTEPECDPLEWLDDPDAARPTVSADCFETQLTRASRRIPTLTIPNRATGVAGVYDVSTDWTPIYDRTDADGFYVAIGTSGNQFKNAPIVGTLLRRLIDEVENGRDHDADPVVHIGEYTGNPIDMATFSRRRPVNAASSGTVMG